MVIKKLYLYACLTQLKFAREIEYNICKSTNNEICLNKFKLIYDSVESGKSAI